jgi:hypothetical protein
MPREEMLAISGGRNRVAGCDLEGPRATDG